MTQLPTGGGKTEIAGALLKDFLDDGCKAVWLTHREELASQTEDRLKRNWLFPAIHATDTWRQNRPAPDYPKSTVILKAQTVTRRINAFEKIGSLQELWKNYTSDDLLVIDEAHHAPATGWERAIEQWPGRVWGLTATRWRLSLREGFDRLFHILVTGPQTSEMQADRYLALSRVFSPVLGDRISGGKVSQFDDFTPGSIERANDQFVMTTLAVNFWRNNAAGRQTVAYAVSKEHAVNLVRQFTDKGISAAAILSGTPQDERERAIADFRGGKLAVLVNVAVATEGFDLPDASCVMITRPTRSLALYLQMVGRGLRPKDDGGDCLILDLAGNAEEHGLSEDYREWSLAARGKPADGDPPVRYCHECNYMAHPEHHKCPECGADLGKPCPRCGKFRPWSRWTIDCPIEHEEVCDYCDPDFHSGGGYDPKQSSEFYKERAVALSNQGDLEGALTEWTFAIYSATTKGESGWSIEHMVERARVHAELNNIGLAEEDFAEAEKLAHEYRGDSDLIMDIYPLSVVYQRRAEMYEELDRPEEAEIARQKCKKLFDH